MPKLSRLAAAAVLAGLIIAVGLVIAVKRPFQAAESPPISGTVKQFTLIDPPGPAPYTVFYDAEDSALKLADFQGKVLLVNFWATWCAPCVREMPSLDRLQAELGGPDFAVLAINEDRGGAKVARPFMEKLGLETLTLYVDRQMALARALEVRGMPATFLIDRQGRLVGSLVGMAEWDAPEAKALIRHYIGPAG